MSDSEGEFDFTFNFTSKNDTNSNSTTAAAKNIRIGAMELIIFFGFWVVMIAGYKVYGAYRKSSKKGKGWFGPHEERLAYEKQLAKDPEDEETLRKLLMRRAIADVRRLRKLQEDKDTVTNLGKVGAISEEMLTDYKNAEKEMEFEFFELQAEAETFKKGWSETIIKEAAQLAAIEELSMKEKKKREEQAVDQAAAAEKQSRDKARFEKKQAIAEEEKKKILEELLKEESSPSSNKIKKRK